RRRARHRDGAAPARPRPRRRVLTECPMAAIPTTVIRHPKERISKCSLRHLHGRPEMTFLRATPGFTFDATGFVLLAVDAPEIGPADRGRPLLLLDSTWRWLPQVERCV